MTDDEGDFRDFANREILDRLQEQKGVTRPSCSEDKRFERAVNVDYSICFEKVYSLLQLFIAAVRYTLQIVVSI